MDSPNCLDLARRFRFSLKFYPAPLASIINGKYNYQIGTTSETNTDNVNIRLNHTINAKNQLSGGLGFQRSNGNNAGNIFQFLDANTGSGINANVGWTYRFTPTFFNTLEGFPPSPAVPPATRRYTSRASGYMSRPSWELQAPIKIRSIGVPRR